VGVPLSLVSNDTMLLAALATLHTEAPPLTKLNELPNGMRPGWVHPVGRARTEREAVLSTGARGCVALMGAPTVREESAMDEGFVQGGDERE
jgi:hypothetical protein